jgi:hypothetical protein
VTTGTDEPRLAESADELWHKIQEFNRRVSDRMSRKIGLDH